MTAPSVAAARFGWACLLGLGLGLCYDFLRPLRVRRNGPADLLFLLAALWVLVWYSFRICRGDIRLGPASGLGWGCLFYILGPGRPLRPVFYGFWGCLGKIWHFSTLPLKKFLNFAKNVFASGRKNCCKNRKYMRYI